MVSGVVVGTKQSSVSAPLVHVDANYSYLVHRQDGYPSETETIVRCYVSIKHKTSVQFSFHAVVHSCDPHCQLRCSL